MAGEFSVERTDCQKLVVLEGELASVDPMGICSCPCGWMCS
jgi:hypothetical protein